MSVPEFAAQNDVAACSLWHWRRVLDVGKALPPAQESVTATRPKARATKNASAVRTQDGEVGFVEVKKPIESARNVVMDPSAGVIEVELPGGSLVRMRGTISKASLASVVAVLMEAR